MNSKSINAIFLWIAIASLILLETLLAKLAFETIGGVVSSGYFLFTAFNLIPIILFILNKKRQGVLGGLYSLASLLFPINFTWVIN